MIYNVLDLEYNFAADFRKEQTNILDGLYLLKQLNRLPDGITQQNNRVAVDTFGNYYDFVYYGGLCGYEQQPCEGMYFFMRLAQNSSGITLPAKIQNALAIFLLMRLIIFANYANPATAL